MELPLPSRGKEQTVSHAGQTASQVMMVVIIPETMGAIDTTHHTWPHLPFLSLDISKGDKEGKRDSKPKILTIFTSRIEF